METSIFVEQTFLDFELNSETFWNQLSIYSKSGLFTDRKFAILAPLKKEDKKIGIRVTRSLSECCQLLSPMFRFRCYINILQRHFVKPGN